MEYIRRDMESVFLRMQEQFKVVLVTGARQTGKTTMLKHLMNDTDRRYVSLDDLTVRQFARSDPKGFIETYAPPVFIDEVQYAPELFTYIKIQADERRQAGDYWLSGSQIYRLMRGVSESLAGRVGLLDMLPLSQNEIYNHFEDHAFSFDFDRLRAKSYRAAKCPPQEMFERIYNGSLPELFGGRITDRHIFYESYIRTYIERDVSDLSNSVDTLKFYRFITSAAARCGQLLNYKSIADDAEIDQSTAKKWLNVLETLGLIFYLHPYSNNLLKRTIKSPKLYFYDSGLVAHLCRWNSVEALMNGAQAGAILENYVVAEIAKSYTNAGRRPSMFYFRNKDGKEIDVVIEENGELHPLEIKKTSSPDKRLTRVFGLLDGGGKVLGGGGVICLYDDCLPLDGQNLIIPARVI
jgi:predicted AAA+ superfamily ATPase